MDPKIVFFGFGVGFLVGMTFFERSLLLPMNHLLSDDQVDAVIDAVGEFFA